jgi:hypothetical protein
LASIIVTLLNAYVLLDNRQQLKFFDFFREAGDRSFDGRKIKQDYGPDEQWYGEVLGIRDRLSYIVTEQYRTCYPKQSADYVGNHEWYHRSPGDAAKYRYDIVYNRQESADYQRRVAVSLHEAFSRLALGSGEIFFIGMFV